MPHPMTKEEQAGKLGRYYTEIKPILADMAHLATLYRAFVFLPKGTPSPHRDLTPEDFRIVELWSNQEMEEVFTRLQALVADIREDYFGDGSGSQ